MSVRVSIHVPGSDLEIERDTHHRMVDGPTQQYRDAAGILREIADDIDRMYPEPPTTSWAACNLGPCCLERGHAGRCKQ